MVFSDTTTNQGIVQDTHFLCGTDDTTYPIAQITRNSNRAMDRVVSLIFKSDARFQWGDDNNTDLSIATADIQSGQSDYSLPVSSLEILKIRIKDGTSGGWKFLTPIDITDKDMETLLIGNPASSVPRAYDLQDNSIILYPTPSYSSTGGIEIYTQRPSSYFTATDTIKSPGFASIYHRYISLSNKFDYEFAKGLSTVATRNEITAMEADITSFYANRNVSDKQSTLRPRRRNYE